MSLARASALVLVAGSVVSAGAYRAHRRTPDVPEPPAAPAGGQPFAGWPAGKPQLALVLSGQTLGYLSPCGCSSPQKGGLERRANFMADLRARGWEVVGLDLGDVSAPKGVHKQNLLKYRTAMKAMAEMGYAAVGLGEADFQTQLFDLLAEYTLNNPNKPPLVLADNLAGTQRQPGGQTTVIPRDQLFPGGPGNRPMVEGVEVVTRAGAPAVGVVAAVGPALAEKVGKLDPQFAFLDNAVGLAAALARMDAHPAKPQLRVLLYAGTLDKAKAAAEKFPQFQLILCQSDDPEPPDFPTLANNGRTSIVQVGHKGQNVGVVGVFPAAGGGFDLKYRRVPLTEEFLTPPGPDAEKAHKVLGLMQEYADGVKAIDSLALHRQKATPHPAQVLAPAANLRFVGSEACKSCHPAEYAQHEKSKHSHAYQALAELAKRPTGRQFDGECIGCHTVGFEHNTGFENAEKTPHLKNVGCESCHGPGSGHSEKPNDKALLALQSPWKTEPGDRLPDLQFVKMMAEKTPLEQGRVAMRPEQKRVEIAVSRMCQHCHDLDNDPHFELWKYLPKIWHSGLGKQEARK